MIANVPVPAPGRGRVLAQTQASLVSAGTERMVVDFAEKSMLDKARSRPDLVKQVVDKAKREGVLTTLDAAKNRMEQPMGLGYSCAGIVLETGEDVHGLQAGDRVACAGGGYANHAEAVAVPKNLVVKLPDNVDFESASFTTIGAIALQGIRLADVKLGEIVAVIGLGLLGQLTIQMLKAAGCIVIGMDIQRQRIELAQRNGADAVTTSQDELDLLCRQFSAGHGADVVLITADTKSDQPVATAGEIARRKGIVVAVGAVGMTIPRKVYYEKELDFRISCSYGPGRYDTDYEEKGLDYPYAYVRWTEQRNMEAFVQLLAGKSINVASLISHRFNIDEAPQAYQVITGKTGEPFLGVVLLYPNPPDLSRKIVIPPKVEAGAPAQAEPAESVGVGIIGGGNFANATLLPALKQVPGLKLVGISSASGLSGRATGDRFGFSYCSTDTQQLLDDASISTVAILTRHHLHAKQVVAALQAGKHVFVEKPLCLTDGELQEIIAAYRALDAHKKLLLMVGYNRRFAPFVVELKEHLQRVQEPLVIHYRANAGFLPSDHWTQDLAQGGGRLMGEGCHFIDLVYHLTNSKPQWITTNALPDNGRYSQDNFVVNIGFENGSLGTVTYLANGDKSFGKEYLEVSGGGLSARLDDYRSLQISHGAKQVKRLARLRQDKGHKAEWQAIADYLTKSGPLPMTFDDVVCSTEAALAAQRSLLQGRTVMMDEEKSE